MRGRFWLILISMVVLAFWLAPRPDARALPATIPQPQLQNMAERSFYASAAWLKPEPKRISLKAINPNSKAYLRYTVQNGDTLSEISSRFDVSRAEIKAASEMTGKYVHVGQELRIPIFRVEKIEARGPHVPPGIQFHTVQRGEVISSIADHYGIKQMDLISANPEIPSLDRVRAGTVLRIPTGELGLVWKLKPNQDLFEVANYFGVPLTKLLEANGLTDPRALQEGDDVLVPGVNADSTLSRLEAKRSAEYEHQEKLKAKAQARAEQRKKVEALAERKRIARENSRVATQQKQIVSARKFRETTTRPRRTSVYADYGGGGGYRWPLYGQITSYYGRRGLWIGRSNFHTGLDIAAGYGSPIRAARGGEVIEAGFGEFGLNVRVATGPGVTNIYGHMSRIRVYAGQILRRGQIIGYEGCTGHCTGPHLHFEVQINGVPKNPIRYLP